MERGSGGSGRRRTTMMVMLSPGVPECSMRRWCASACSSSHSATCVEGRQVGQLCTRWLRLAQAGDVSGREPDWLFHVQQGRPRMRKQGRDKGNCGSRWTAAGVRGGGTCWLPRSRVHEPSPVCAA